MVIVDHGPPDHRWRPPVEETATAPDWIRNLRAAAERPRCPAGCPPSGAPVGRHQPASKMPTIKLCMADGSAGSVTETTLTPCFRSSDMNTRAS